MNKLICCFSLAVTAATAVFAEPYVGADVGYLIDSKEAIFSGHLGYNFLKTAGLTHGAEVEVATTTLGESNVDFDLVPVFANYRLTAPVNPQLDVSSGVGAGFTHAKLSGFGYSDSDNAFSAQGFASFTYKVTPKFAITGRARYLWMGNAELFGYKDKIGDDVSVDLGLQFSF